MQPYVGASAFTHKGGLHVSAVMKDPQTYEHVPPESVGNKRIMPVSAQSGRANVAARLAEAGIAMDGDKPDLARLLEDVKQREFLGYSYDDAAASFELLARRAAKEAAALFHGRAVQCHRRKPAVAANSRSPNPAPRSS